MSSVPGADSAALSTALLSLDDLPPGWTLAGPLAPGAGRSRPCPGAAVAAVQPTDRAGLMFAGGVVSPLLYQEVLAYAPGEGEPAMAALRATFLLSCEWQDTELDAAPMRFRLLPMPAPAVGDESAAQRLLAIWETVTIDAVSVALRRGDMLTIVTYAVIEQGPAAGEPPLPRRLVERADARLAAAAGAASLDRGHPEHGDGVAPAARQWRRLSATSLDPRRHRSTLSRSAG